MVDTLEDRVKSTPTDRALDAASRAADMAADMAAVMEETAVDMAGAADLADTDTLTALTLETDTVKLAADMVTSAAGDMAVLGLNMVTSAAVDMAVLGLDIDIPTNDTERLLHDRLTSFRNRTRNSAEFQCSQRCDIW